MARTIQREGLANALREFGVDSAPQVALLADFVAPTILLQDLRHCYEPALRARILVNASVAAAGAGRYSAHSLQSPQSGMWLLSAAHTQASSSTLIQVATAKLLTTESANITGIAVGSRAGQVASGSIAGSSQEFLPYAMEGDLNALASTRGLLLDPRMSLLQSPLWIPPQAFLLFIMNAANAVLSCTYELQIPAIAAGPWLA